MSVATRPGCECSSCRDEDEVYHFVCHDCADGVEDALEFHESFIAGQSRVESLAEAHRHDNVEYTLVWEADDG